MIQSYKDLYAWQKSMDLVVMCYDILSTYPSTERYGLVDQMKRSAVSIPSNIAEGFGRYNKNDFAKFLFIARGSLCELQTQIELSFRIGYIDEQKKLSLNTISDEVHRLINGLITKLKFNQGGGEN